MKIRVAINGFGRIGRSVFRILSNHPRLRYYQAGMDMGLSSNPIASFHALQQRILQQYEYMIDAFALLRLDATLPIKQQQQLLREAVTKRVLLTEE